MADGSITFDIDILDKRAKQRLDELDNLVKEVGDSMDDEMSNSAYKFISDWNKANDKYQDIMNKMKNGTKETSAEFERLAKMREVFQDDAIMRFEPGLIEAVASEQERLANKAQQYAVQMDNAGIKAEALTEKIRGSTTETTKQMTFSEKIKGSFEMIKNAVMGVDKGLKSSSSSSAKLKSNTDGLGNSIKSGIKQMIKLSTVMLGMRGIMGGLRKVTNQWYNSMDMGARQAKANMESVTNGIVNLLAPALTFITSMLATLMGYLNAIARTFFGVDLLSKKTAKNVGAGAKNAKKMGKEIKGFTASFDEADVASSNIADNLDGAGGGGGMPDLEPNIKTPDLSEFKSKLENLFKPFLDTMKTLDFEPMKEAFRGLAKVGKESAEIIGMSFVRTMNEAVAPFIKLMVEDIIPKGLNTVTRILERFNPVIDRLLKKFVEPLIEWFLLDFAPVGFETVFSILEGISGILAVVVEAFNVFWDSSVGRAIAFLAGETILAIMKSIKEVFDEVVASVDFFFTKLEEGDPFAQALAFTLGAIVSALIAWQVAQAGINAVTAIFNAISPFGWIVIAIAAVIAIILVLYKNWDDIVAFFEKTLADIGQWFADKWQGIKDGFDNMVKAIQDWWKETTDKLKEGWNNFLAAGKEAIDGIKTFFEEMKFNLINYIQTIGDFWASIIGGMWDGIKDIIENIKGIFRGLIDFIAGVFSGDWERAWNGIVSVFDNIVSGIANIFKWPINAMIYGINAFIRGINRIKIPTWVPGVGGAGFNIAQIPRLKTGAALTHQTTATMAEYPNARTNPEIVSPQKIMRETMAEALALNEGKVNSSNGGGTYIFQSILDGRVVAETVKTQEEMNNLQLNGAI